MLKRLMLKRLGKLVLVIALWQSSLPARGEVSGYLKSLWLRGETVDGLSGAQATEDFIFGVNRWRLIYRERFSPTGMSQIGVNQIGVDIQYDNEIRLGDYIDTQQYQFIQSLTPEPYWHWQTTYHRREKVEARHGFYRATVSIPIKQFDLRVGRQQINWARTFLWSSFDRFNPYDPLQIEPEERRGVDGLRFFHPLGDLQSLEVVAVGGHNSGERGVGALWKTHVGNTDLDLLAADFGAVTSVGLAGAGQLGNIGWRFETTGNENKNGKRFNEWIVSADYTFATQTTVVGEFLYRGDGQPAPEAYDIVGLISGDRINLARRYVGLMITQSFEPLAVVDLTLLHNLDDSSTAYSPSLRYTPGSFPNLQWRIGALLFSGGSLSEYGRQEHLLFGELQWFY